ncbi:MAG: NYN domain-containing protein [Actinomycetota bacterium]
MGGCGLGCDRAVTRVGVFVDGQNITIGARYAFGGSGAMHPLLLGRALAGDDTLVEIRYASGLPDPRHDPRRAASSARRHELMRRTDVVVLERTLRYRWEWEIRDRDLPNPRSHQDEVRQARVESRHRGQEKGIDVWLALDALVMCTRADLDRVVIASADTDLDMVPHHLRSIPGQEGTEVVAAKIHPDDRDLHHNDAYDRTVGIDRAMFEVARDRFDYDEELDDAEVTAFLDRIGSAGDGIRD